MLTTAINDLNALFRNIYPGFVLTIYVLYRWIGVPDNQPPVLLSTIIILSAGTIVYPLYKIYYDYIVRAIELNWCHGFPEYRLYLSILDELHSDPRYNSSSIDWRKMRLKRVAIALYANFITEKSSLEFKAESTRFNSLVHVIFISGFLCGMIFLAEILLPTIGIHPLQTSFLDTCIALSVSSSTAIIMTFLGIIAGKQSDLRETIFLAQNKEEFKHYIAGFMEVRYVV